MPVEELCRRVSKLLFQRTPPAKYATSFVASVELANGRLRYTNAGHNPALLVRASGAIERLGSSGVPLGMLPDAPFAAREVDLAPGDLFVTYTDGIVEAVDPSDEEFGLERLEELCRDKRNAALADSRPRSTRPSRRSRRACRSTTTARWSCCCREAAAPCRSRNERLDDDQLIVCAARWRRSFRGSRSRARCRRRPGSAPRSSWRKGRRRAPQRPPRRRQR